MIVPVDPNRSCSVDNVCEQQCVHELDSSNACMTVEVCSCRNGYTLGLNMKNCSGENNCKMILVLIEFIHYIVINELLIGFVLSAT